jgi:hypothetical protein
LDKFTFNLRERFYYILIYLYNSYVLSNAMDATLRVWDVRPFAPSNRCMKVFHGKVLLILLENDHAYRSLDPNIQVPFTCHL